MFWQHQAEGVLLRITLPELEKPSSVKPNQV